MESSRLTVHNNLNLFRLYAKLPEDLSINHLRECDQKELWAWINLDKHSHLFWNTGSGCVSQKFMLLSQVALTHRSGTLSTFITYSVSDQQGDNRQLESPAFLGVLGPDYEWRPDSSGAGRLYGFGWSEADKVLSTRDKWRLAKHAWDATVGSPSNAYGRVYCDIHQDNSAVIDAYRHLVAKHGKGWVFSVVALGNDQDKVPAGFIRLLFTRRMRGL